MKLDLEALKFGIAKNLRNSQELIDEAEILFERQKFARSYLLSHISIEESSKCAMLLKIIAFIIWEQEIDLKNVRKRYSNHKEKIKNFELLNLLTKKLNYNEEDFNKIIEDTNNSKNDSLYVSWSNENNFILPSEKFNKERAEEKLNSALEYCKLYTSISIQLFDNENEIYRILEKTKTNDYMKMVINGEKERKRK
jgi:AbiV family abortive infection protein